MKKYSESQKKEILGFSVKEAVEKFGVTESTYYKWKKMEKHSSRSMSFSLEDDYLVIRVPKKMVAREIFSQIM